MNHLATFTLGFLVGSLTLHTFNRRQENAEIERLEDWAEAQVGPSWDGEDPLPPQAIQLHTISSKGKTPEEIVEEVRQIIRQQLHSYSSGTPPTTNGTGGFD